jgi:hypothetical protein
MRGRPGTADDEQGGTEVTVGLAIGGVILLAMVGVSCYGWATLPNDARVPTHFGPVSYNNFQPKRLALILYPVAGAVCLLILTLAGSGSQAHHGPVYVILPIVMVVILITEAGAIRAARRGPDS